MGGGGEYVFNRNCDNAPRRPGQRAFPQITRRGAGLSVKALLGPNDQRVFYNLYVEAGQQLTTALRAQAALKVSPEGAYASHHTAARLWGAWAPESPETHRLGFPGDVGRSKRRGIVAHEGVGKPLPTVCRGLALSTPAQTFLDLAGSGFNLVDLVAFGDSIIRRTGLEAADLVEPADRGRGHGAGRARRAARLVRDGVDSVMESRLRMLIVLAGLPEPRVNVKLRHDNGEWWMRFDLCYEDCRVGRRVRRCATPRRRGPAAPRHQAARGASTGCDTRVVIVTSHHLNNERRETLRRIRAALVNCGIRGSGANSSRRWERYFRARP